jgi:uncharacterized protein YndB with AHSA1/START domain
MTRVFDAPRELVFDALTKPELIRRWLGVRGGWSMIVCEVDLKPGGAYRYVWRKPNVKDMGMGGVYQEIVRPERIVCTESFDEKWYEGGDALDTMILTEENGETTLTTTVLAPSKEVRDAVLKSPMSKGVIESYDMLDEVLESAKTPALD